jgi:hypothetical protein
MTNPALLPDGSMNAGQTHAHWRRKGMAVPRPGQCILVSGKESPGDSKPFTKIAALASRTGAGTE